MLAGNRYAAGEAFRPEPLRGFVRPVPTQSATGLLVLIAGNYSSCCLNSLSN